MSKISYECEETSLHHYPRGHWGPSQQNEQYFSQETVYQQQELVEEHEFASDPENECYGEEEEEEVPVRNMFDGQGMTPMKPNLAVDPAIPMYNNRYKVKGRSPALAASTTSEEPEMNGSGKQPIEYLMKTKNGVFVKDVSFQITKSLTELALSKADQQQRLKMHSSTFQWDGKDIKHHVLVGMELLSAQNTFPVSLAFEFNSEGRRDAPPVMTPSGCTGDFVLHPGETVTTPRKLCNNGLPEESEFVKEHPNYNRKNLKADISQIQDKTVVPKNHPLISAIMRDKNNQEMIFEPFNDTHLKIDTEMYKTYMPIVEKTFNTKTVRCNLNEAAWEVKRAHVSGNDHSNFLDPCEGLESLSHQESKEGMIKEKYHANFTIRFSYRTK